MRLISMAILSFVFVFAAAGCAKPQGDSRLREVSQIEAEKGQEVTDGKALEMEARLARQQRFFQGVSGTFQGKMKIASSGSVFDVKFIVTPSIPSYTGDRTRSMDEITWDLTNLTLSIESSMTKKLNSGDDFSTGCNYTDLRPKTDSGFIYVTVTNCPVTYTLSLGESETQRRQMSAALLDGDIDSVDTLFVEMRSVNRGGTEVFKVKRTGF